MLVVGKEGRPTSVSRGPHRILLRVVIPRADRSQKPDKGKYSVLVLIRFNDPSAGSPTETLLRLLLPLGGRV